MLCFISQSTDNSLELCQVSSFGSRFFVLWDLCFDLVRPWFLWNDRNKKSGWTKNRHRVFCVHLCHALFSKHKKSSIGFLLWFKWFKVLFLFRLHKKIVNWFFYCGLIGLKFFSRFNFANVLLIRCNVRSKFPCFSCDNVFLCFL